MNISTLWLSRLTLVIAGSLTLLLMSIPSAVAEHAGLPRPLTLDEPFSDADFEKARVAFKKGQSRRAAASIQARMGVISKEARRAFAISKKSREKGEHSAARTFLDRYMSGPRPILEVHRDRFFFNADLYRLHAHAAFEAGNLAAAAASFAELLASGRASEDDRQNARALVERLGDEAGGLKEALSPGE